MIRIQPIQALVLEVHPNADNTATLIIDYGDGKVLELGLRKSYTTFLLALSLARIQDKRSGLCSMVGCRMPEKLAKIYCTLPGAMYGSFEGRHFYGYKSRLLKFIKRRVRKFGEQEQGTFEEPLLFRETIYGQGYCLGAEFELRGVDVNALFEGLPEVGA